MQHPHHTTRHRSPTHAPRGSRPRPTCGSGGGAPADPPPPIAPRAAAAAAAPPPPPLGAGRRAASSVGRWGGWESGYAGSVVFFWLLMLHVGRVLGSVYGCSHRKRLVRITTPTSSNEPTAPPKSNLTYRGRGLKWIDRRSARCLPARPLAQGAATSICGDDDAIGDPYAPATPFLGRPPVLCD